MNVQSNDEEAVLLQLQGTSKSGDPARRWAGKKGEGAVGGRRGCSRVVALVPYAAGLGQAAGRPQGATVRQTRARGGLAPIL